MAARTACLVLSLLSFASLDFSRMSGHDMRDFLSSVLCVHGRFWLSCFVSLLS